MRKLQTENNLHDSMSFLLVYACLDSNSGLDGDGMRELCAALKENTSLTDVNLSRNRFGAEGASLLEGALDSAPKLGSLDIRR